MPQRGGLKSPQARKVLVASCHMIGQQSPVGQMEEEGPPSVEGTLPVETSNSISLFTPCVSLVLLPGRGPVFPPGSFPPGFPASTRWQLFEPCLLHTLLSFLTPLEGQGTSCCL